MHDLTLKQRWFAHAYVNTGNIEHAAKAAEITVEEAQLWLIEPDISAVIVHDKVAAVTTAMETRDRIMARYAIIANADYGDYFVVGTECSMLIPLDKLTKEQRMCIKKIKHTQHGPELELYDRMHANNKLAEAFKIFADDTVGASVEEKASQIRTLLQEMDDVTDGFTAH